MGENLPKEKVDATKHKMKCYRAMKTAQLKDMMSQETFDSAKYRMRSYRDSQVSLEIEVRKKIEEEIPHD